MRIEQLQHAGLTFDVVDSGPLDGEPVVLLHGFPERASSWGEVSDRLTARGLRTLALDQRGYSPGARPTGRRDYAVRHLVGDVCALIDRVGGSAHLVGHDWGSAVAWATAIGRPDAVRTLTAVSVPHPAAFAAAMRHGQLGRSSYMAFFQLPWLPERLLSGRGGRADDALRKGGLTDADVDRYHREVVDTGALRTALHWYRGLPFSGPAWAAGNVRVPTTYVWSDRDVALGRWGAEHTGDHVDADYEFVELSGVSHWIPTQAPDALAESILDRVIGG